MDGWIDYLNYLPGTFGIFSSTPSLPLSNLLSSSENSTFNEVCATFNGIGYEVLRWLLNLSE